MRGSSHSRHAGRAPQPRGEDVGAAGQREVVDLAEQGPLGQRFQLGRDYGSTEQDGAAALPDGRREPQPRRAERAVVPRGVPQLGDPQDVLFQDANRFVSRGSSACPTVDLPVPLGPARQYKGWRTNSCSWPQAPHTSGAAGVTRAPHRVQTSGFTAQPNRSPRKLLCLRFPYGRGESE